MSGWAWAAVALGGYLLLAAGILLILHNVTDWDRAPDEHERLAHWTNLDDARLADYVRRRDR